MQKHQLHDAHGLSDDQAFRVQSQCKLKCLYRLARWYFAWIGSLELTLAAAQSPSRWTTEVNIATIYVTVTEHVLNIECFSVIMASSWALRDIPDTTPGMSGKFAYYLKLVKAIAKL